MQKSGGWLISDFKNVSNYYKNRLHLSYTISLHLPIILHLLSSRGVVHFSTPWIQTGLLTCFSEQNDTIVWQCQASVSLPETPASARRTCPGPALTCPQTLTLEVMWKRVTPAKAIPNQTVQATHQFTRDSRTSPAKVIWDSFTAAGLSPAKAYTCELNKLLLF